MSQQYANFKVRDVFGMPDIPEKVLAKGYADSSNPFIPQTTSITFSVRNS